MQDSADVRHATLRRHSVVFVADAKLRGVSRQSLMQFVVLCVGAQCTQTTRMCGELACDHRADDAPDNLSFAAAGASRDCNLACAPFSTRLAAPRCTAVQRELQCVKRACQARGGGARRAGPCFFSSAESARGTVRHDAQS